MSLDLTYVTNACVTCGRSDSDHNFNVTYNLSTMWHEAIPNQERLIEVDGMIGKDSLPLLEEALKNLESDPAKFKEFNPPNRWGSYEGLVSTLHKMCEVIKKFPDGTWNAWR